ERAQDDDTAAGLEVLLEPVRVVRVVDVLEVRLVEHRQDVAGDAVEVGVELGPGVRRAGRVVGMADVDELRALVDRGEERVEVVAVVAKRHAARLGADLDRVDDVAREGRPAADDYVAGVEDGLRQAVDDAVRPCAERDLLEADVMPLGEGGAQAVPAAVRVAVQLVAGPRERLARGRERAERPLVRGELDDTLEPELALDLLYRLPRLVRDEVGERPAEEALLDLGHAHARSLRAPAVLLAASLAAEEPERARHGAERRSDERGVR